jgi:signal transduction histidine kinase
MAEEPASTRAQALARLIPPLAHRLNNLLALGAGELDLRSEHPEVVRGPERRAQAAAAVASLAEAGRLIRSLARFAKGPLGEPPLDVDARELLREVDGLCRPAANEHGVQLALEQRGERALFEADGNALSKRWSSCSWP